MAFHMMPACGALLSEYDGVNIAYPLLQKVNGQPLSYNAALLLAFRL